MPNSSPRDIEVEELGAHRRYLLAELAKVEEQLRPAMRRMRDSGATWQEIIAVSSYTSIEGIKKAIDPKRAERSNERDRAKRAERSNDGRTVAAER